MAAARRGRPALPGLGAGDFELDGVEGDEDVAKEGDEGGDQEEHARDEDGDEGKAGFAAEEGDEEQAEDEHAGGEHAATGEGDGEADEAGAAPHDVELAAEVLAVVAGCGAGLAGEAAGAVDDAAHAIGERDGERADAGDEDDRRDRKLDARDEGRHAVGGEEVHGEGDKFVSAARRRPRQVGAGCLALPFGDVFEMEAVVALDEGGGDGIAFF